MLAISDNQIIVILSSVFVTGILALRLGKKLYQ
uniref:Photosystem I protein M n=1 Tax=Aneura pinguis TaxID=39026 RepID=A0A1Z1G5D5_ANEPI|nr:photosystem I protein M [Aneura pinguis]ARV78208.1 photosystem I protein M [Aneura pinguis]ARV78279.1 photosystem I protein M [Aneura pinguis]ARV78350.1 photosystem I protein M [Aneura pinguis]ARV78420.1 photosystem I protein M [Aneura pinguis]ASN73791.1 photosystem I protein M [Aneura pinguis]